MEAADTISYIVTRHHVAYNSYLHTLIGAFQDSILNAPFFRAQNIAAFESNASLAKKTLQHSISSLYSDFTFLLKSVPGYKLSSNKSVIDEFANSVALDLTQSLSEQAEKDLRSLRQVIAEAQMGVLINSNLSHKSIQKTLVEIATKRMHFLARNGARWKSERFVKTSLNWHTHRVHNETVIYLARQADISELFVYDPTDNSKLRFALDDYQDESFRNKYFHPNSKRLVISG